MRSKRKLSKSILNYEYYQEVSLVHLCLTEAFFVKFKQNTSRPELNK